MLSALFQNLSFGGKIRAVPRRLWWRRQWHSTPVLWPPDAKSWLSGKDFDAGRDWGQEEKGTTEDEMAGWHHWLDGRRSQWTPGVGGGQGGLACCDSWGCKESDTTERLNWSMKLVEVTWVLSTSGSEWISRCISGYNIPYTQSDHNPRWNFSKLNKG